MAIICRCDNSFPLNVSFSAYLFCYCITNHYVLFRPRLFVIRIFPSSHSHITFARSRFSRARYKLFINSKISNMSDSACIYFVFVFVSVFSFTANRHIVIPILSASINRVEDELTKAYSNVLSTESDFISTFHLFYGTYEQTHTHTQNIYNNFHFSFSHFAEREHFIQVPSNSIYQNDSSQWDGWSHLTAAISNFSLAYSRPPPSPSLSISLALSFHSIMYNHFS